MNTAVLNEIVRKINRLPDSLQRQVLSYVDALQATPMRGSPGKALLEFAGLISPDELKTMTEAIESGCERVENGEW